MTERARAVLNQPQLMRVVGILMGSFVLTAVLGIIRQSVIGARFGAGAELDAYFAANRVSETLFSLISGGALGSAFIPVFARYQAAEDMDRAWRLARGVMSWVALLAGIFSLLAFMFADPLAGKFLIPAADEIQLALTVSLMRVMLITVLLFSVSGLCMAILNTHRRFFAASLTAGMYNIGLIIGALVFAPFLGIYGLAWGAVLGAVLHLGVQLPALRQIDFRFQFQFSPRTEGLGEVLRLMLPRVLGLATFQINFWVNTAITNSTRQEEGSLSELSLAFILLFSVLGVIGQSVGTAVFPTLSALHASDDTDGFRRVLSQAMRGVIFMALPATAGLMVLAIPFVDLVFAHGSKWTPENTAGTAWALALYAIGLVGFGLQEVLARAFYARRNTWMPVIVAVLGLFLNVALSIFLIGIVNGSLRGQGSFGGLALANALTTLVESAVLWLLMSRALRGLQDRNLLLFSLRAGLAALAMGAIVYGLTQVLSSLPNIVLLFTGATVGVLTFEGLALLFRIDEARSIPLAFLRRVKR